MTELRTERVTGDFLVVHHPVSPFELYVIRDVGFAWDGSAPDSDGAERLARLREYATRPGGWNVLEVRGGLGERRDWLAEMVAETRAPVMIVSLFEGELCGIRGLAPGPHAAPWGVRLHEAPSASRYPTPKHRDLYPLPLPPKWLLADDLLNGAPAVAVLADWSAAAGGSPDRAALAALPAEKSATFAEDVVARLLDALGLSEHVEPWYPHEFHCWDDPVKLERSIAALQPGRFRALDCAEHQNCFALVRMRAEGDDVDYEIEWRESKPDVLYRAVTPSLEKVVAAMKAWVRGETRWREDFEWSAGG